MEMRVRSGEEEEVTNARSSTLDCAGERGKQNINKGHGGE
jgi:hypothetical protein